MRKAAGRTPRKQKSSAHAIARALADRIEMLAPELLGEPSFKTSTGWRWGTHGSLLINVHGQRRGRWHSFETGQGGDTLDLIAWKRDRGLADALHWARNWLGGAP